MVKLCPWFIVILMLLLFCRTRVTMIMCFPYDVAAPSLSQGCASEQLAPDCFLERVERFNCTSGGQMLD